MIISPNAQYVAAYSLVLASLSSPTISAGDAEKPLLDNSTLTTRIETEWGVLIDDGGSNNQALQKMQLMIEPELETDVGDDSRITTIVRSELMQKTIYRPATIIRQNCVNSILIPASTTASSYSGNNKLSGEVRWVKGIRYCQSSGFSRIHTR